MSKILPPVCRAPGNYDQAAWSNIGTVEDFGPSLAVQSQKDEADINVIVKRFGLTGTLPDNPRLPTYGDFEEVYDFQSAMQAVRSAQELFHALPATARAVFNNDPQQLIEAVDDPDRRWLLEKAGLIDAARQTPSPEAPRAAQAGTTVSGGTSAAPTA